MSTFKELPAQQRLFRAAGVGILLLCAFYCGYLAVALATKGIVNNHRIVGGQKIMLLVSLVLACFCCLVMATDAWDLWMRERKYPVRQIRKVQMAVLILLGLSLALSALVVKWALFMTIAPAVIIYPLLVVRPTSAAQLEQIKREDRQRKAMRSGRERPSTGQALAAGRQRRGGRKRRRQ